MWRTLLAALEIAVLSAVVLLTRCANYEAVFVGGEIYFVDPDCYARMIRARMVMRPGHIVRHHDFENFPIGTKPHTTAPLDYLIAFLAAALRPVTAQPLNLAGALVSPLLGLARGLVSVVVVAKCSVAWALCCASDLRAQRDSGSWDGAGAARSAGIAHPACSSRSRRNGVCGRTRRPAGVR